MPSHYYWWRPPKHCDQRTCGHLCVMPKDGHRLHITWSAPELDSPRLPSTVGDFDQYTPGRIAEPCVLSADGNEADVKGL